MTVYLEDWSSYVNGAFGNPKAIDGRHLWTQGIVAGLYIDATYGWRIRSGVARVGVDTDANASITVLNFRKAIAARFEPDVGDTDMYARATLGPSGGTGTRQLAVLARQSSGSGDTFYEAIGDIDGSVVILGRVEAGVRTGIVSVAHTWIEDDTLELRCNGTTITVWVNGVEVLTTTSAHITTGTRGGLGSRISAITGFITLKTFQIGELDGSGVPVETPVQNPTEVVEFTWVGAVTTTTATVATRVRNSTQARLVVSVNSDLSAPVFTGLFQNVDAHGIVKLVVTGLTANTAYFFGVETDTAGVYESTKGQFRTFPSGQSSISLVVGGDAGSGTSGNDYVWTRAISNSPAYDFIRQRDPTLFLFGGDLHYRDIDLAADDEYQQSYRNVLSAPRVHQCFRSIPIAYVWDDHDYTGSSGATTGQANARAVFRQYVPHYPVPVGNNPIYQSFACGRVRIILLDVRSAASGSDYLGATQLAWLENEVDAATEQVFVLHVIQTWIAPSEPDTWFGAATQRTAIADIFESRGLTDRLIITHCDSHSLAIDDGTNSHYASTGSAPGPVVICGAPIDSGISIKGGTYSEGRVPAVAGTVEQQYMVIGLTDNGTTMDVAISGWQIAADGLTEAEVISHSFQISGLTPDVPPAPPISAGGNNRMGGTGAIRRPPRIRIDRV